MMVSQNPDDRAWDEVEDEDEDDIGWALDNAAAPNRPRTDRKRRWRAVRRASEGEEQEGGGVGGTDYPLDLWFTISEYIWPEDVGRFAALCQATLYITTTSRFWLTMYKRHYQWTADLPEHLTHWNLDPRRRGLKAAVVRALFFMYPPFSARLAAEKPLSADPTRLLRAQCILQWHKKSGRYYKYFFKFTDPSRAERFLQRDRLGGRASSGHHRASSVCHNPDEGCWFLEASSTGLCGVAMVMGQHLYHAGLGVSANMCSHCLRLSFVPAHLLPPTASASTRRHRVPATEITLDPVVNVRLYSWWHPQYPRLLERG